MSRPKKGCNGKKIVKCNYCSKDINKELSSIHSTNFCNKICFLNYNKQKSIKWEHEIYEKDEKELVEMINAK